MGRGRQKAKQTKVARELKYYSPATNYHELEQELRGNNPSAEAPLEDRWAPAEDEDDQYDYSKWADYAEAAEA